jgi:hypothetical protein
MHNPEETDSTISAITKGAILGFSGFDVHGEKALHAWMKISNAMPPSWMR